MKVEVHNTCTDYKSYRAARVKSLFNAETGAEFHHTAELPIEDGDWSIGVIVGPSGSGKTSLGHALEAHGFAWNQPEWPDDAPIIDAIGDDFDAATGALAAVGLGDVPSWLRPHRVLSMGEQFRADLARLVVDHPDRVIVDEFTSVVDRQIAKIGAFAFQKAWRRTGSKAVLLTCHYDVLEWLEPDWVYDTHKRVFAKECLQRPRFDLEIWSTDWSYWPLFEPHHYLKAGPMPFGKAYVGIVDGEPVCHLGVSGKTTGRGRFEARLCRLVVMPEWQGAGVGLRMLNHVAQLQLDGADGAYQPGRPVTSLFHTSHPGLCAALRRDQKWRQVSAVLHGNNKAKSRASIAKARNGQHGGGFGGHFRAVQGFRYHGAPA